MELGHVTPVLQDNGMLCCLLLQYCLVLAVLCFVFSFVKVG